VKLRDIYSALDKISPFELQEKWDNSGLIIGDMSREISTVVVSLDIDEELLDSSDDGVLFVVHHPLIFGGLNVLDFSKYPSNLIEKMVKKGQSLIAMHTNFDKTHLNRYVFEEVLGFDIVEEGDFLCRGVGEWSSSELLTHIKKSLDLEVVKVVAPKDIIRTISMT